MPDLVLLGAGRPLGDDQDPEALIGIWVDPSDAEAAEVFDAIRHRAEELGISHLCAWWRESHKPKVAAPQWFAVVSRHMGQQGYFSCGLDRFAQEQVCRDGADRTFVINSDKLRGQPPKPGTATLAQKIAKRLMDAWPEVEQLRQAN